MPTEVGMLMVAFLRLLSWVIIARALLSWFVRDPDNPLMRILSSLTDPMLRPFRKHLTFGMMDVTPLVAILVLYGLQMMILRHLMAG